MGMLMNRHRADRAVEDTDGRAESEAKPLDRQNKAELQETARTLGVSDEGTNAELRDRIKAKQSEDAEPPASPYEDLTDEQVLEAYAANIPDGDAEDRDAMVAELVALDESDKD